MMREEKGVWDWDGSFDSFRLRFPFPSVPPLGALVAKKHGWRSIVAVDLRWRCIHNIWNGLCWSIWNAAHEKK
jgi:hypothetical protein